MEATESLRDIEAFENKMKLKPNRYPKISLEKHLKLDDDMKVRIGERLAKHEK